MTDPQEGSKPLKARDDRKTIDDMEEKLLMEQTLVNERRTMPGEQAPSGRIRSPAERDRARADEGEAPDVPEVAPVESQSVKRVSSQSKPRDSEKE